MEVVFCGGNQGPSLLNNKILRTAFILSIPAGFAVLSGCKHPIPEPPVVGQPPVIESQSCDEDSVYFQEQILPIFQSSCAIPECHDQVTSQEGFTFDSYEGIMEDGEVLPIDNSDIYEVITETDPDDIMPPPPQDPLTEEQIQLFYTWATQGALNNSCPDVACDTLAVSFSNSVFPTIVDRCQGCHSGDNPQGSLWLTNYDEIQEIAISGALMNSLMGVNGYIQMPYTGNSLSNCQIRMFEIWIENGAPND